MGIIIFISYSRKDNNIFHIPELSRGLEKFSEIDEVLYYEGVDYNNIVEYMEVNIKMCHIFLSFWSKNALQSENVEMEWHAALLEKKRIITIFYNHQYIPTLLKPYIRVHFKKNKLKTNLKGIYLAILKSIGYLEAYRDLCINLMELGRKFIESKKYEDALDHLQQAGKIASEKPLDPELIIEIKDLISQLLNLMEKKRDNLQ